MVVTVSRPRYTAVTVVVQGLGAFPLDMLRVDSCVALTSSDTDRVQERDGELKPRRVSLRHYFPVGQEPSMSVRKWSRHGWEIVSVIF